MMSITPPDPEVIQASLRASNSNKAFTATEFRHFNSPTTRQVEYGVDDAAYIGARTIMAPKGSSNSAPSPFSAIPEAKDRKSHFEAIRVFSTLSDNYLEPDRPGLPPRGPASGWHYENFAADPREYGGNDDPGDPAALTQVPTSTTNPARPRTVAAGYDSSRQCLTVVFRDGTYYNYYDVPQSMWNNFKRAYSPGRFILAHLDSRPRGVADVQALPDYAREALYRIVRTGQIQRGGLTGTQTATAQRRRYQKYGQNLGGTGRARLAKNTTPPLTG